MEIVEYCVYGDPVYGRNGFGPASKCPSNLERESVTYVLKSQFDRILSERDTLQQRLSAVEEENDRLRGHALALLSGARAEMHESWKCNSYHPLLTKAVSEAERELENRS